MLTIDGKVMGPLLDWALEKVAEDLDLPHGFEFDVASLTGRTMEIGPVSVDKQVMRRLAEFMGIPPRLLFGCARPWKPAHARKYRRRR